MNSATYQTRPHGHSRRIHQLTLETNFGGPFSGRPTQRTIGTGAGSRGCPPISLILGNKSDGFRTAIICRVRLTTAPADCPLICVKAACGRPRMSVMPMLVISRIPGCDGAAEWARLGCRMYHHMIHKGLRGEMICATSGLKSSRARMKYVLAVGSSKIDDVIVTVIGQNTRKRTENGSRPIRRRYVNNLRRSR